MSRDTAPQSNANDKASKLPPEHQWTQWSKPSPGSSVFGYASRGLDEPRSWSSRVSNSQMSDSGYGTLCSTESSPFVAENGTVALPNVDWHLSVSGEPELLYQCAAAVCEGQSREWLNLAYLKRHIVSVHPDEDMNELVATSTKERSAFDVPSKRIRVYNKRTLTGCVTCRRRKKKCDEAKPECGNCLRNSIACEAYFPKYSTRSETPKTVYDDTTSLPKLKEFGVSMRDELETRGIRLALETAARKEKELGSLKPENRQLESSDRPVNELESELETRLSELRAQRYMLHQQKLRSLPFYNIYTQYSGRPPLSPGDLKRLEHQIRDAEAELQSGLAQDSQQFGKRLQDVIDRRAKDYPGIAGRKACSQLAFSPGISFSGLDPQPSPSDTTCHPPLEEDQNNSMASILLSLQKDSASYRSEGETTAVQSPMSLASDMTIQKLLPLDQAFLNINEQIRVSVVQADSPETLASTPTPDLPDAMDTQNRCSSPATQPESETMTDNETLSGSDAYSGTDVTSSPGPNNEELVNLIMNEFRFLFDPKVLFRLCGTGKGAPRTATVPTSGKTNSGSTGIGADSSSSRKRAAPGSSSNTSQTPDEDDGDLQQRPLKISRLTEDDVPKLFACPFYKNNIQKYRNHRSCCGPGWREVRHVKDHIYRRHRQPTHCERCFESFEDEKARIQHVKARVACESRDDIVLEGIDPKQERQLRSKKRLSPDQTPEDAWRNIYRICFPEAEDTVPSPYYDDVELLPSPGFEHDFTAAEQADYIAYSQRELPRLVREHLEMLAGLSLEERLRIQIVDAVRVANESLLQSFQQTRRLSQPVGGVQSNLSHAQFDDADTSMLMELGEQFHLPRWSPFPDQNLRDATSQAQMNNLDQSTSGGTLSDSGYGSSEATFGALRAGEPLKSKSAVGGLECSLDDFDFDSFLK